MRIVRESMNQNGRSYLVHLTALVVVAVVVAVTVWYASHSGDRLLRPEDEERGAERVARSHGERTPSRWEGEGAPPDSLGQEPTPSNAAIAEGQIASATLAEATEEAATVPGPGHVSDASSASGKSVIASASESGDSNLAVPGSDIGSATAGHGPQVSDASPEGTPVPSDQVVGTPTPGGRGDLTGRVAGRITGNPIPGVNVLCSLAGVPVGTVVTDRDGGFFFSSLESGVYQLETIDHRASTDAEVIGGQTTEVLLSVDDGGSISGRVVDTRNWAVQGATVRLLRGNEGPFADADEAIAQSGSDGSFFIMAAPIGVPIKLQAENEGYAPATRGPFVLHGDTPLEGVELVLTAGGAISGRVTDREGNPIASARLEARVRGQWGRVDSSQMGGVAETDPSGAYQIPNIPPGEWEVRATATGFSMQQKQCSIAADETVTVDFNLEPGDIIVGMVVGSAGQSISGANVRLLGGLVSKETGSAADGTFHFDSVPEGTYSVAAERAGYSPAWRSINTKDTQEVVLALQDLATFSVRVTYGGNQPVQNYSLTLKRKNFPQGLLSDGGEIKVKVSSSDGLYSTRVGAGAYQLTVTAEGYQPAYRDVALEPGAAASPTEVELRGGLTLPGRVVSAQSGTPIAGARVSWFNGHIPIRTDGFFIPDSDLLINPLGTVLSDGGGWFLLDGLPPQNITVVAYGVPGFAPWVSRGLYMGYPPDELMIEMQPGVRVTGSVSYQGLPFPYAAVELQPEDALREVPPEWRTDTDGVGEFAIEPVCPGLYRLLVTREYDGSLLSRGFRVEVPFADTRFDIEFPRGEVSVTLIDEFTGAQMLEGTVRLRYIQIQDQIGGMQIEIPPILTLKYPDGAGAFTFVALPAGEYSLEASATGFANASKPIVLGDGERLQETMPITPNIGP